MTGRADGLQRGEGILFTRIREDFTGGSLVAPHSVTAFGNINKKTHLYAYTAIIYQVSEVEKYSYVYVVEYYVFLKTLCSFIHLIKILKHTLKSYFSIQKCLENFFLNFSTEIYPNSHCNPMKLMLCALNCI